MSVDVQNRLEELGIVLPEVGEAPASFVHAVTTGNLVYTSGAGCEKDGEFLYHGKLGQDVTTEQGYEAARQTMINLLAVLDNHLGSLDKIKRIVKVNGFINCVPNYTDGPLVINGASDLLEELFGEKGKHARSSIGVNSLPFGMPVEIEMIIEMK